MKFSSSKKTEVLLLLLLVAALVFAGYYYFLLPKKNEVQSLETSISTLNSDIASLESQIEVLGEENNVLTTNVFELRNKVPDTRDIDDIILSMEEIEYSTGSRIIAIDFNNYDELVSNSGIVPSEEEQAQKEETAQENTDQEQSEETTTDASPVSTIANLSLPPELKLITYNVNVETPDYPTLLQFIKEVEKLERIMHIDLIEYSLPGEKLEFEENPNDNVDAEIQITTFYYEGDDSK